MRNTITDTAAGGAALAAAWWSQYLSPLLQAIILILTAAFMGLGVLIRWRQWRTGLLRPVEEEDQI